MTPYRFKADPASSHGVLLRWAGQGFGRHLLEVGAGVPDLTEAFRAQGWKVTTLDRESGADFVRDLNDPSFHPVAAGWDTIICGDILEHLIDPVRVLRWLAKGLLPEGRILVSVPNVAHLWMRLNLLAGRWQYTERGILDRTHCRFFTEASLRDLVTASGLRIVRQTATPVPVGEVLTWWPGWLQRGHAVAARAWPRLLGYQFVLCTERVPKKLT